LEKRLLYKWTRLSMKLTRTTRLLKKGWLCASNTCVCIVGRVSNLLRVKLLAPLEKTDNKNSLELLFLVGVIN
jgi:propanediol utilization protein